MKIGTQTGRGCWAGAGIRCWVGAGTVLDLVRATQCIPNQLLNHDQAQTAGLLCKFLTCCKEVPAVVIVLLVRVTSWFVHLVRARVLYCAWSVCGQLCPWIIYHSAQEMDSCFYIFVADENVNYQRRVLGLQETGFIALPLYFGAGCWDRHVTLPSLCQLCFSIRLVSPRAALCRQQNECTLPVQSLDG